MSLLRLAAPIVGLALSFNVAAGQQSGTILLDPGHGGIDAGSWPDGQPPEKWISLRVSYTVAEAFTRRGLDVRLTRNGDETRTLAERAALARDAEVVAFVSLHANTSPDPSAEGIEVLYSSASGSADLAERVRSSLGALDVAVSTRAAPLSVWRDVGIPAVMIQVGYDSHPADRDRITSREYHVELADRLALALAEFVEERE